MTQTSTLTLSNYFIFKSQERHINQMKVNIALFLIKGVNIDISYKDQFFIIIN